jgi:hypothetical protein
MAAGINILVNDGGAPARIMKLGNAAADIDAGTFVGMSGATVSAAILNNLPDQQEAVGVLFVDATSGDPASVVTGSGIQVFLKSTGTIAAGDKLGHNGDGVALKVTDGAHKVMGVALEAKSATHTDFTKVVLL